MKQLGQAEIEHLLHAVRGDLDIGGFRSREWAFRDAISQCRPFDEFEDGVRSCWIPQDRNPANIGVIERRSV